MHAVPHALHGGLGRETCAPAPVSRQLTDDLAQGHRMVGGLDADGGGHRHFELVASIFGDERLGLQPRRCQCRDHVRAKRVCPPQRLQRKRRCRRPLGIQHLKLVFEGRVDPQAGFGFQIGQGRLQHLARACQPWGAVQFHDIGHHHVQRGGRSGQVHAVACRLVGQKPQIARGPPGIGAGNFVERGQRHVRRHPAQRFAHARLPVGHGQRAPPRDTGVISGDKGQQIARFSRPRHAAPPAACRPASTVSVSVTQQ